MTNAEILVCAWRDALNARDVARMLSLTSARIEVITPRGTEQGPACVREFIERQTYGVGLHLEQPRVFADGDTVVLAARRAALGGQRASWPTGQRHGGGVRGARAEDRARRAA